LVHAEQEQQQVLVRPGLCLVLFHDPRQCALVCHLSLAEDHRPRLFPGSYRYRRHGQASYQKQSSSDF
jgi:hypothetical protein